MSLFSQAVTIENRTASDTPDAYGNDQYTTSSTSGAAWYEPRASSENTAARDQVVDGLWLYLPLGSTIRATSAVIVDGIRYEVDGEPGRQPGGLAVEGYVKVALTRVQG